MLHLHHATRKRRVIVFLDISSASIAASIVVAGAKQNKLVWSTRVEYGYQSVDDFERYVRTMYATLLEVGMKVKSDGLITVKREHPHISMEDLEVRCVYGSPWVFSAVAKEQQTGEKPFIVTNKLCEKLQETACQKVLASKQAQLWQEVMGSGRVLESYTDTIAVRGYIADDFAFGKRTNDLQTQHFFSIVPESVGEHVEEVIEKLFPNHNIHYSASTRVLMEAMWHTTAGHSRLIVAEVSGEMTNVTLLRNGKIADTTSISLGVNHLLRAIVPNATSAKEARGAAEVQIKTKKSITTLDDLPQTFHEPMTAWQQKIFEAVKAITGGVAPPSKSYVVTDFFWEKVYVTAFDAPYTITDTHNEIRFDTVGLSAVFDETHPISKEHKEAVSGSDARLYLYFLSV